MRIATRAALTAAAAALSISCASVAPNCACANNPDHPGCKKAETPEAPDVEYILAEARFGAALGKPREVEINQTPTYEAARESFKSAAIRPPDNCLTETASEVKGEARQPSKQLASQRCGVWLSEIEKSLAKNGFRVVSWDALRTIEENERVPPYKAAKKLGADILFLFNSLEISPVEAGGESAYRIEYATSNAKGEKGPPKPMTETERSQLKDAVIARSRLSAPDGSSLIVAGVLDATAIQTANGESIWFYRNTEIKTLTEQTGQAFLFGRIEGEKIWYLAERQTDAPSAAGVVAPAEKRSAVDTGGQSISATQDAGAAERLTLMRAVTSDFVDSFRTGKKGDNE